MVDDLVPILALRQVIDSRHVQQHFEIESRIVFQRAEDLLDVSRLTVIDRSPRNSRIPMRSSGKRSLNARAIRSFNLLLLIQETDERGRRRIEASHRCIHFGCL